MCALALVVLWGARRLGVGRPSGPIELCGHLPLDARRSIYLVRVGAQVFIVGVGEGGFTKLGELAGQRSARRRARRVARGARSPTCSPGRSRGGRRRDAPQGGLGGAGRPSRRARSSLVVALALVSLLPLAFMTVTAFVKIATVLQIVRSAIGAQSVPSGTVIMALAAALTLVAMAPVGDKIAARAAPLLASQGGATRSTWVRGGIDAVREPLREFLRANASETERERFFDVARRARRERPGGSDRSGRRR